jgi:hypothetical protein
MGGGVKRVEWRGIDLTWFYILGSLLLSIFIRDIVNVAMIFCHIRNVKNSRWGECLAVCHLPAETNLCLMLSVDAHFY